MSRVLETPSVAIVKIAGQITDLDLDGWSDFVKQLESEAMRWIVLDFCDVSRVDRQAAALLVETLPKHVLLLNCPIGIRNMADSGGLRSQVLEATTGQTATRSPREHRDAWEALFPTSSFATIG
jgi:ABC-type transporter Mla MlaB component